MLARLADEIWREHYAPLIGMAQVEYMLERFQSAEAIERQIREGFRYHLALDGAEPVGYFATRVESDHLYLDKFYVLSSRRRNGIGRAMIDHVAAEAVSHRLGRIRLSVNRGNATALAAYERLGFRAIGTRFVDIGGGHGMDDFVLEKTFV